MVLLGLVTVPTAFPDGALMGVEVWICSNCFAEGNLASCVPYTAP